MTEFFAFSIDMFQYVQFCDGYEFPNGISKQPEVEYITRQCKDSRVSAHGKMLC